LLSEGETAKMGACRSIRRTARCLTGGDMKRRPRTNPASEKLGVAPPARDPEVVAFIAAVLRQMDHAANLVVAFFRSVGALGPTETSLAGLPGEFLLELAALLQLREWHAAGLIDWFDSEGLSIDDMIGRAIERLKDDPTAVAAGRAGTDAMTDVLRIWAERCAPDARGHLDADVALRWDNSIDLDAAVDAFATFLCRHRDAGEAKEAI
jgi:hypothetical protein